MVFVEPTWFQGLIDYGALIGIPMIIAMLLLGIAIFKEKTALLVIGVVCLIVGFGMLMGGAGVIWHYQMEEPSVQTKIVTVDNWQPTFGTYWGKINSADDLMMQTTDGELFGNTENFLFNKFNTRDILNQLKPNGTYEIKYYGWREGFNNGVPNILSVTKVIDENNTQSNDISHYMNKRSIIYEDGDGW